MNTDYNQQIDPNNDAIEDNSIHEVVETLQSIDETSLEAPLNETSIDDNNGGRIELGENSSNIIKR